MLVMQVMMMIMMVVVEKFVEWAHNRETGEGEGTRRYLAMEIGDQAVKGLRSAEEGPEGDQKFYMMETSW